MSANKLQGQFTLDFGQSVAKGSSDRFSDLRQSAFNEFEKLGLPTTRHEEWKYTSLKHVAEKPFVQGKASSGLHLDEVLKRAVLNNAKVNRLVFVNGIYDAGRSAILDNRTGIVLTNLAEGRSSHPELFTTHFGKYARTEGMALNAMNAALPANGAFIHVADGGSVEHPVVIINIADSSADHVLVQPRNLVVLGRNASLNLVETYYATGTQSSFTNVVSEIYLDANAHLEHYKVQHETGEAYHNNFTQVFQEADTSINHVTLTLDGTLVRNNLHFYMNGSNGDTLLYGLYITERENHVDNHTRVDHAVPNCNSNELYKGLLRDRSTAVFNGKIVVHEDAQKTNAYQRNQNILLSMDATVNTKPQLEIFADDVKCTHGATVGQLNEEPVFYLRSRGIPEAEARRMLLNAFADEIAERIKIDGLVQVLEEEIARKL